MPTAEFVRERISVVSTADRIPFFLRRGADIRELTARLGGVVGREWAARPLAALRAALAESGIALSFLRRGGKAYVPYVAGSDGIRRQAASLSPAFARQAGAAAAAQMPRGSVMTEAERRAAILLHTYTGETGRLSPAELRTAIAARKPIDIPFRTRDEMSAFLSLAMPGYAALFVGGKLWLGKPALQAGYSRQETERAMLEIIFRAYAKRGLTPGAPWGDSVDTAMRAKPEDRARLLDQFFVFDSRLQHGATIMARDKHLLRAGRLSPLFDPTVLAVIFATEPTLRSSRRTKASATLDAVISARRAAARKGQDQARERTDGLLPEDIVIECRVEPDPSGRQAAMETMIPVEGRSSRPLRDISEIGSLPIGTYPKEDRNGIPLGYLRVEANGSVTHLDSSQTVEHNPHGPSYVPGFGHDTPPRYSIHGKPATAAEVNARLDDYARRAHFKIAPRPDHRMAPMPGLALA